MVLANYEALLVETHLELSSAHSMADLRSVARDLEDATRQITEIITFFASNNLIECIPLGV